jgi:hypothetical protein
MAVTLSLKNFSSRVVRSQIVQDSPVQGYRYIGKAGASGSGGGGGLLGFLKGFFGKALKFTGWLINVALGGLSFTFTTLWGAVVATTSYIYNFNWNVSDTTLDQQLNATKQVLAGQLGATMGNAFGFLACGVLPAGAIAVFNEPLGAYLLKEVGEEALEEFAANLAQLLRLSFRSTAQYLFISAYKNVRFAIKRWVSSADNNTKNLINKIFGSNMSEAIKNWGEPNSKPWSFRLKVEEAIDNIQNPLLQEFVEEFYDEALDSCVEAGYVIAGGLDTWYLEQALAKKQQEQESTLIELQPDRQAEEEKIILYGGGGNIKQQVIQTLSAYQLVEHRDVGQIIGEPVRQHLKKNPMTISLRIMMRGKAQPPFINADGTQSKRVQITVPNVSKAKIDWQTIKFACGGTNGYNWGRFLAKARLSDGNVIQAYGATADQASDRVKALLALTDSELLTLNVTEIQNEGKRKLKDSLRLKTERIYPAWMTILNQYKILNEDEGIATPTGTYKRRRTLIPLWTDTKPDDFQEIVNQLFYVQGTN